TSSQSVKRCSMRGSATAGTAPPAPAIFTHTTVGAGTHWYTPSRSPSTETSSAPPRAPPGTSTRHVPSAATVTVTVLVGRPPPVNVYPAVNRRSFAAAASPASCVRASGGPLGAAGRVDWPSGGGSPLVQPAARAIRPAASTAPNTRTATIVRHPSAGS